jgi:hypothetical protein
MPDGGSVSLFAWYQNGTPNVEIRLMPDKGKFLVKQKSKDVLLKQAQ